MGSNLAKWSVEQDAVLTKRWLAGDPASDISKSMGRSRSAICGRVLRLGLKRPKTASASRRRVLPTVVVRPVVPRLAEPTPPKPPTPVRNGWPVPETAVGILALNSGHCRWPVGLALGADQLFCGATPDGPVAGVASVYCPDHRRAGRGKPAK